MKKLSMFRRVGAASIIITVLAGALCSERTYAQNPAPIKKAASKKPADALWYGEFTLTIKGKGKLEGRFEGDPDIEWKVDRTYYSNFQLTRLAPNPYAQTGVVYRGSFTKGDPLSVKVTVADELKITKKGRYQHDTIENTTSITKWEEDKNETGEASDFQLFITNGRYRILFVALPDVKERNLIVGKATVIERSSAGFGDKPTSETLLEKPIFTSVTSLTIPQATNTISLQGLSGRPLFGSDETAWPSTYPSLIQYDSKDVEPDAPLIPGIPDSKTNLKIRVICRLSTTPIY